jgi:hypothetical protein
VQVGLNKGEAKNALARAVFFNRLGELRDRSFENQRYRASGLNLVVAAIVLWNTVYLERAIKGLREAGQLCTYQREQPCLLAHRQLWMPLAGSLLTGGNFCFLEQLCAAGSGPGTHAHPSDEGLYVVGGHCTIAPSTPGARPWRPDRGRFPRFLAWWSTASPSTSLNIRASLKYWV